MHPWPRLDTHQEDQAVQEECVEEADGAGHLVGENQPPLGNKRGMSRAGAGLTHPCRAHPSQGSKGREGQAAGLSLQCLGWELGPQEF